MPSAFSRPMRSQSKAADAYDDEYFRTLDRETRPLLEQQLSKSISAVASMIFGAWEAAGRPPLPLDPPAEVKRCGVLLDEVSSACGRADSSIAVSVTSGRPGWATRTSCVPAGSTSSR